MANFDLKGQTRLSIALRARGQRPSLAMALGVLLVSVASISIARAGRFIAAPFAETLPRSRLALNQLALYEERSAKDWRSLSRLDLGMAEGLELGLLAVSPKNKPSDVWINLEYRFFREKGALPALALGLWDSARKGNWFSHEKTGPSPFLALGKSYQREKRFLKAGIAYGFNRLDGFSGGAELRFLENTGLVAEYVPENLRLPNAKAFDIGVYRWLGKRWRARASWMGGNSMVDVLFIYSLDQ